MTDDNETPNESNELPSAESSDAPHIPPPSPYAQPTQPPPPPPPVEVSPPPPPPPPMEPVAPQMGTYYSNQQGYVVSGPKNDPFAVTSMVVGIVGVPLSCCCTPLSFVLGIIATVFGALSMSKIKKMQGQLGGQGMAVAGLVLGICVIGLSIASFAFGVVNYTADLG
ncbi:MAG TPA: DUF4190 domain-containing protein [Acidimicrobiia bacterium]|nr:DUF4190 domain-containing protein [Acidimicrobiia bacterium]